MLNTTVKCWEGHPKPRCLAPSEGSGGANFNVNLTIIHASLASGFYLERNEIMERLMKYLVYWVLMETQYNRKPSDNTTICHNNVFLPKTKCMLGRKMFCTVTKFLF